MRRRDFSRQTTFRRNGSRAPRGPPAPFPRSATGSGRSCTNAFPIIRRSDSSTGRWAGCRPGRSFRSTRSQKEDSPTTRRSGRRRSRRRTPRRRPGRPTRRSLLRTRPRCISRIATRPHRKRRNSPRRNWTSPAGGPVPCPTRWRRSWTTRASTAWRGSERTWRYRQNGMARRSYWNLA